MPTVLTRPQHSCPFEQSEGTLQESGESQAFDVHIEFGIVGDIEKSRQHCSPWSQSASLSQRKTRAQPIPSLAHEATCVVIPMDPAGWS